mmetsp:Transcript_6359/g.9925  ORF Transcript_6359/g.9925 Transcript_6359/m.9925 type:complete len:225 (+) Transcript_6359:118-792(+)
MTLQSQPQQQQKENPPLLLDDSILLLHECFQQSLATISFCVEDQLEAVAPYKEYYDATFGKLCDPSPMGGKEIWTDGSSRSSNTRTYNNNDRDDEVSCLSIDEGSCSDDESDSDDESMYFEDEVSSHDVDEKDDLREEDPCNGSTSNSLPQHTAISTAHTTADSMDVCCGLASNADDRRKTIISTGATFVSLETSQFGSTTTANASSTMSKRYEYERLIQAAWR